ncbi:glutamate--glyoxylate aminotransferase 2 isoform X1 [Gossypium raimondii]|uniref:glutamate--glyoxylate aminotransferase 2 isoform X1 n=1 Tax=Gossypium raimondii TaxID=29730 RepID=UPI00063A9DBD|nr:glutamate--glyoxylate aminotransferase 2 isoform X1 [Gossypium raimondii]
MGLKALDYETMNENVKKVQYAVRGELYLRASELQKEGKKIIFTNVGNPQALGQKPLTFPRQVVALCQAPFLLDDPNVGLIFPADAIARAKHYLSLTSGGLGAYSDSRGIPGVRKEVAEFIERRDGYPSDPELIFLTDGASKGVMQILNCIIRGQGDGVLVPVPQYPLYSATISLFGGSLVPYYLEETANWGLDVNNLRESVAQARFKGITVRAMVIINPGNPTGQCLSEANLREILNFCYQENLVLLGDEVYQQNIYQDERPFISSRKVLMDMGPPISKDVQLVSFHTVSKGYWGECGQRGGYFEMTNIPPKTVDEIYKIASISLSPNVPAQIFMGLMVNPLKPGDVSYDQFVRESKGILESLRRRARIMTDGFNSCKNVVCNFTEGKSLLSTGHSKAFVFCDFFSALLLGYHTGAMYSFPQLRLPPKAIEAAKQAGKVPDVFYCLKLLEATGISTVPGSGFGQKEGVFHLRTTILPAEEDMPEIMSSFKKFNDEFMAQYEDNWNRSRM